MKLNKEQIAILEHTANHAVNGIYCGNSADMKTLVSLGLMKSAGRKSFVPDEYFCLTGEGVKYINEKSNA